MTVVSYRAILHNGVAVRRNRNQQTRTSVTFKAISQAIYPGDTASKLNAWPPEPPWFADARAEYANKFETA